jgi:siroheme synthase-like protein
MLLSLDVRDWPCLVVGGGPVGARRALRLADAGAVVTVVSPDAVDEIVAAADAGRLRWERRPHDASGMGHPRLVVTATDDPAVNARVAADAPAGCLVCRADDAGSGEIGFPALAVDDGVEVAVASAGGVPGLSRWVAGRLAVALDGVVGLDAAGRALLSELLGEIRRETAPSSEAMAAHPERQGVDWRTNLDRTMLDPVIWDLIRTGRRAEAKERLQACLSSS